MMREIQVESYSSFLAVSIASATREHAKWRDWFFTLTILFISRLVFHPFVVFRFLVVHEEDAECSILSLMGNPIRKMMTAVFWSVHYLLGMNLLQGIFSSFPLFLTCQIDTSNEKIRFLQLSPTSLSTIWRIETAKMQLPWTSHWLVLGKCLHDYFWIISSFGRWLEANLSYNNNIWSGLGHSIWLLLSLSSRGKRRSKMCTILPYSVQEELRSGRENRRRISVLFYLNRWQW